MVVGAPPQGAEPDRAAIERLVQRQAAAWQAHDAEGVAAGFTRGARFLVPGHRFAGRDAIRRAAEGYFASGLETRVEVRRVLVDAIPTDDGDTLALVEWRWSERAKGKAWSVADDAIVFTVRDGLIDHWREYIDRESPTPADAPAP